MRLVACLCLAWQPDGRRSLSFVEKAIGDSQTGLAGVIAEGRDQITVRRRAADDLTHGLMVSLASPSSASRRRAAQSSFVIGVAEPLSNASRNLASSACLAWRFWASRIRAKVFAGRSVSLGGHLGLDEGFHLVGQRNIHGGHGSCFLLDHHTVRGKYCQEKANTFLAVRTDGRSGGEDWQRGNKRRGRALQRQPFSGERTMYLTLTRL